MFYHPFKKSVSGSSGKKVTVWYYWYYGEDGKRVQKVCTGPDGERVRNESDAYRAVSLLPEPAAEWSAGRVTVSMVAGTMYVPGSPHFLRMKQYGRFLSEDTLSINRRYMRLFIALWGSLSVQSLTEVLVDTYLLSDPHSGSWKNSFIENLNEVLEESKWYGAVLPAVPHFHRFVRNSRKPDILSTSDINRLFVPENFISYQFYILFLTAVSGGLRLGEVRALRPCQVDREKSMIVVDGFIRQNRARMTFCKKGSPSSPRYRVTVISSDVMSALCAYIDSLGIVDTDLVFTKDGKFLRKEYCEDAFARALDRAEISESGRRYIPHSLRYTFVTRMMRNLDIDVVKTLAGHASVEQTEEYNRAGLSEKVRAAEKPEIADSANGLFD
jgi:integrase